MQQALPIALNEIYEVDHLIELLDVGVRDICAFTYRGHRRRPDNEVGIYNLYGWDGINKGTLQCTKIGHESKQGLDFYTLIAPAVPTFATWPTRQYKGSDVGWAGCLSGDQKIAGPRLLPIVDTNVQQVRSNRGMEAFEEAHCEITKRGKVDKGDLRYQHTLQFRLDESPKRTSSLEVKDKIPDQVHYKVYRKIELISELDGTARPKPYEDVISLYLVLRQSGPHQVVARSLGKSVNVMTT